MPSNIPNTIRKLTPASIMDGVEWNPENGGLLYTIFGRVDSLRYSTKESRVPFGPWVELRGWFEALRTCDGVTFNAPGAFLPEPIQSMIVKQFESGDVDSLEFAFEIWTKKNQTPIGFEYFTKPLVKMAVSDPLADLRQRVVGQLTHDPVVKDEEENVEKPASTPRSKKAAVTA